MPEPQLFLFPEKTQPEDQPARAAAIDPARSILVQAPAGAGKTGLLTQRFLALLAEVEDPEQILAITFTRAATAEMRDRILGALEGAQKPAAAEEKPEIRLARAALKNAHARGWQLLEQPHRLDVQTIDSLCLRFAHGQPLLARLGGALAPTEDAEALYAAAARRTTALLDDTSEPELQAALRTLLLRRDNNLGELEQLLAGMLARRDAWLAPLPLRFTEDVDWQQVRARLEEPFVRENQKVLAELRGALEGEPELAEELLALARYAAGNVDEPGAALLRDCHAPPHSREEWMALAQLLLTGESGWRKQWTKSEGFPAPGTGAGKDLRQTFKQRMKVCCGELQAHPTLLQLLCRLRALPPLGYSPDQWDALLSVFRVLRRAAAELRLVFAETDSVDFVEIAQAAQSVLEDEASMRGLLESEQKRHLLIDEFQDTSRTQYRLVARLLREWAPGDGRTAFVVGDPLQSIYGFRQAEVALFHDTRQRGLPCGDGRHACHPLQLTHNFRSHAMLVDALNRRFEAIFAEPCEDVFVPAHAWPEPEGEESLQLHARFVETEAADPGETAREEAEEVVRVLQAELPRIQAARERGEKEYKVAILVSARSHLSAILPALRANGIPYRAVDLEPLSDRPEVHDLLMLLRALLHPADRVAWLTVLRAPWCGLGLRDLHMLAGADDPELLRRPVPELIASRETLLSPEGQARLTGVWQALREALRTRYTEENNLSLAGWFERTWMALGGPACLDATARENAEAFLRLLDTLEPSAAEVLGGGFAQRLAKLCAAPNTEVSERFGVQLMTIHKAKGLGFKVVLLPGLHRRPRGASSELVAMLQRAQPAQEGELADELLIAPLGSREDAEADRAYAWVVAQRRAREAGERKRLFYVACTRARTRLHLFATVEAKNGELRKPAEGSLLAAAWPALEAELRERFQTEGTDGLALAAAAEVAGVGYESTIERLPADWKPRALAPDIQTRAPASPRPLFNRAQGSLAARARGTAMHALLEQLTAHFAGPEADAEALRRTLHRAAEHTLRAGAFPPAKLGQTAAELVDQAMAVAGDPVGRWLLAPHPRAAAESAWQTWDAEGNLRTLRVDRTFRAGEAPHAPGEDCLWIVDYKTGAEPGLGDRGAWRAQQQQQFRPQLEAYAAVLTAAAPRPVRFALYFPELLELVFWS